MTPESEEALSTYRGRRALVTGASGFLGRWVARLLGSAGADLWVAARDGEALAKVARAYEFRGEFLLADLATPGSIEDLVRRARPHIVFHLAGYGVDPAERDAGVAEAINIRLVREVAEAVAAAPNPDWPGLHLVHAGTSAEYGRVEGTVTDETTASPASLYGRTKLRGTQELARVAGRTPLRAAVARLFNVYGPGEHPARLLPTLLAAARSGTEAALSEGTQRRDFIYVADAAEALLRIGLLSVPPGVINVATGRLTSVREFAECVADLLGLRRDVLHFGALESKADEILYGEVDTARLRRLIGWTPRHTVHDGIRETIEFEARANPAGD